MLDMTSGPIKLQLPMNGMIQPVVMSRLALDVLKDQLLDVHGVITWLPHLHLSVSLEHNISVLHNQINSKQIQHVVQSVDLSTNVQEEEPVSVMKLVNVILHIGHLIAIV